MTGRNTWCYRQIDTLLKKNKLAPHFLILKPDDCWDTLKFKLDVIKDLKKEYQNINELLMYDDREEHVEKFWEMYDFFNKKKIKFIVYHCVTDKFKNILYKDMEIIIKQIKEDKDDSFHRELVSEITKTYKNEFIKDWYENYTEEKQEFTKKETKVFQKEYQKKKK